MSWIDEASRKVAERENKQKAHAAKEAQKRKTLETRMINRVAAELKRLLPSGVVLVDLPRVIIDEVHGSIKTRAEARISLGNGVQFAPTV